MADESQQHGKLHETSPAVGAAELAGCEADWAVGANWAGPHFRAPELRSANAGSEAVPFAVSMLLLDAAAAGAVLMSAPNSPPFCVPARQMLIAMFHCGVLPCSDVHTVLAGLQSMQELPTKCTVGKDRQ